MAGFEEQFHTRFQQNLTNHATFPHKSDFAQKVTALCDEALFLNGTIGAKLLHFSQCCAEAFPQQLRTSPRFHADSYTALQEMKNNYMPDPHYMNAISVFMITLVDLVRENQAILTSEEKNELDQNLIKVLLMPS